MERCVRKTGLLPALCVFLFMLMSVSTLSMASYPQTITTSTPFVNIPRPDYDPLWAEAFSHWDKRDSNKEVLSAIETFGKLSAAYPDKLDPWLWLTRSSYLMGVRDKSKREEWMQRAVDAGDKAHSIDPKNGYVFYWKFAAVMALRDLTEKELRFVRKMGAQYSHVRELVVPEDDPAWKEAIKLWDDRGDRDKTLEALKIFSELDKKYPDRIEPKLWLARAGYWIYYITEEKQERLMWLMYAANNGRRALALEPRNPAACWWTAVGLGQYGSDTSPVNIAKHAMEIIKCMQVVLEEDPIYFYGGVSSYLARAFAYSGKLTSKAIEMFGFSRELVERTMKFSSEYEPRYLRSHYALAEYYISRGKTAEAKTELQFIINADPKALPLMEPENLNAQKDAKKLLATIE